MAIRWEPTHPGCGMVCGALRTIAFLELLGALVGLMVLVPEAFSPAEATETVTLTCGTDSQGNSHLLDKLLTTKYPLGVILMEVACQASRRRASLRARWIPRLENEEADALTNGEFHHFRAEHRIPADPQKLEFIVLNELFAEGEKYVKELEELRACERRARNSGKAHAAKRAKGDRLSQRDSR